jgi:hypothetical protein
MKKWMIFAVIAAVFMVTFPACGGDDDGGPSASSVVATLKYIALPLCEADGTPVKDNQTSATAIPAAGILVTWEGGAGYDYYLVWQDKNDLTKTVGGSNISAGQNLYTYEPYTPTGATAPTQLRRVLNTDKGQWSVLLSPNAGAESGGAEGIVDYPGFYAGLKNLINGVYAAGTNDKIEGRFGVAAAEPGGFPLESVKIQWDIENEDDGAATPVPTKQVGYLKLTIADVT